MNATEREKFKTWFRETHADKVMLAKGAEYSGTGRGDTTDINGNFKRVAGLLGIDPLQVAMVYALKHLDSILTYIKTKQDGTEPIFARFGDLYNYVEIMASLVAEEKGQSTLPRNSPWANATGTMIDRGYVGPPPKGWHAVKDCNNIGCISDDHFTEVLTVD